MAATDSVKMQKKSLNSSPDQTRTFEKGKIELANFSGDVTVGRATFEPGWSWEKCVKPIVKTNSCDAVIIPPGHNAWVVGNEPCVAIDFTGAKEYAKNQ
jgi:hypothetical protein